MNDNEGTRNFDTVQPEETKVNKYGSTDPKKKITIAIFVIAIVIVLLFCAVIVTKIVYKLNNDSDSTEENEETSIEISYKTKSFSSSVVNEGLLLIIGTADDFQSTPSSLSSTEPNTAGDPYYIGTGTYPRYELTLETVSAFKAMTEALYSDTEIRLVIGYAYDSGSPEGEECEHVLGTVLDIKEFAKINEENKIDSVKLSTDAKKWINENCAKYGFIVSMTHEDGSTQLRYVGVAHATYITENDLAFSSYIKKVQKATPSKPISIDGADGNKYAVYYVEADGEETEVQVPESYSYEISGDNKDGFIITVNLSEKE